LVSCIGFLCKTDGWMLNESCTPGAVLVGRSQPAL